MLRISDRPFSESAPELESSVERRWRGAYLFTCGVVLLLFGLFLAPLILADLRAGHRFWISVVAVDVAVAVALIIVGYIERTAR